MSSGSTDRVGPPVQVLVPPPELPDDPPDDPLVDPDPVEVEVDGVVLPAGVVELALVPPEPPPLLPVLEYKSEYQPPPLRMNPVPREIWRLAVWFLHFGHSLIGSSLMDCSSSNSLPQELQAYS